MANNIFSVVTLKFKTPEAGEAFADKFGNCDMLDMELYKYLGFDDYPSRSEAIDHGGAKWFWLHDNPQPGYGEDETEVHMCIESAWYIPNNLFETIAKQEDCSITGYAEDEYRNAWTLFEFCQDFDDHEVYDSFLREDTVSDFITWCKHNMINLDELYEAAADAMTFEDDANGGELIREFLIKDQEWSELFFFGMPAEFTYTWGDMEMIREEIKSR
jgi:hypothetical protein